MGSSITRNFIGYTATRRIRAFHGWILCHGWGLTKKSAKRRLERVVAEVIQGDL